VSEGDSRAKDGGVLQVASGSYQVSGDDGFAVTRFQGMHRSQPERDGDSCQQPSGAQLRLVQELGQIICVHTSTYLGLLFGAGFAACGDFRISSKYLSTKG